MSSSRCDRFEALRPRTGSRLLTDHEPTGEDQARHPVCLPAGVEGLVGDCVLLGGTSELAQLRRDHRRLVEGRQDAHRSLAVGELLADALTVGVGQSQSLVVQGPGQPAERDARD